MDQKTIKNQIDTFVSRVKRSGVHNPKIYLYGSALTKKNPHDIDLIVVGSFPTEDPDLFLYGLYTDIPRAIDFQVYGLDLKNKNVSPFIKDSLLHAKRVG